jgi:hypothetical protein
MKQLVFIAVCGLLGAWMVRAEPRVFTNTDGKTVEAELVSVEDEVAVLKLSSGGTAKVPLTTLSANDQTFVAEWWKENKDKLKPMDVRLTISKKTERIDRKVTRSGGGTARPGQNTQAPLVKKLTIDDFHYVCELKSYVAKDVSDINVTYTIYRRVSVTDKEGSRTAVEEIGGETSVRLLEAHGSATFETEVVRCEDSSQTGGNKPRELKRETILGVVFDLSAGGKDFLRKSFPENLVERLEELRK